MKIQGLAVLAIVIILPMTIILNAYTSNQIKTLDLQISYDTKLQNATYDAIKAFQMNMSNSTTSDLANSKMRDIKASIQTFYNSLSSHFDMAGYGEEVLKDYVPAIVYTLYDGYYIYSAYDNTLDEDEKNNIYPLAIYQDGETIYGLKPYIYYSCRYKPNNNSDFVITYSLDSYITIQGILDGNPVNESGYLLTGAEKNTSGIYYKGVKILEENNKEGLQQKVYLNKNTVATTGQKVYFNNDPNQYAGSLVKYPYKKINGVKYYKETETGNVFSMMNDEKLYQTSVNADSITQNNNGIKYYEEAIEFTNFVKNNATLIRLSTKHAVDSHGIMYSNMGEENPYYERPIFSELNNSSEDGPYIEDANSEFNAHKTEVIKNSIETNLKVAIANYNKVSTSDVNFAMPRLQDYEWEMLTQNISMITFLQGLSIGGKVYNGHSIVQNNINEEFVSENSIYISDNEKYYGVTSQEVLNLDLSNCIGLLNTDFERRTSVAYYGDLKKSIYYYPREEEASYNSVISLNDNSNLTISEYFKDVGEENPSSKRYKLAQIYYTALGRERNSMYRVNNIVNVSIPTEYAKTNTPISSDEYQKNWAILKPSPNEQGEDLGNYTIKNYKATNYKKTMSITSKFMVSKQTPINNYVREQMIVSTTENSGWALRISYDNSKKGDCIAFQLWDGSKYVQCIVNEKIQYGVNYNVAATYDGTDIKVYVNGTEKATTRAPGIYISQDVDIPTMIAANPSPKVRTNRDEQGYGYFCGTIYNVRLWYDQVLNQEQIQYIYNTTP